MEEPTIVKAPHGMPRDDGLVCVVYGAEKLSPDYNQLVAALEMKMTTVALVRSAEHQQVLLDALVAMVSRESVREGNERLYRPHLAPDRSKVVAALPICLKRLDKPWSPQQSLVEP